MQMASHKNIKVECFGDDCWTIEEVLISEETDSTLRVSAPNSEISLSSSQLLDTQASNDVPMDRSVLDKVEEDIVTEMFGRNSTDLDEPEPCCQFGCNCVIPVDMALEHRRTFQEMSKQEQDLILLGQFQVFRRSDALEAHYGRRTKRKTSQCREPNKIVRKDMSFMFYSFPICKKMYFFLHDLRETRYKNLCAHFDKLGIHPRKHKSKGKARNRGNELTPEDINSVVTFIKSFAESSLPPSSGRTTHSKNSDIIKLPSKETKCSIHRLYCDAMESQPERKKVARSTFSRIWKKYCPYVVLIKPSADLRITVKKPSNIKRAS